MGDTEITVKSRKMVFVTVGTTCFDALVKAVETQEVKDELLRRGYTQLLIQMGRGTYVPTKFEGGEGSLAVDYFTFSSSIADHLRSASLVISHAGSGSIFETLQLGKPLIVVVNEDLMDNHQSELAEELADRKHLYYARPHTLHQIIADMKLESLVAYHPGDATPVAKLINRFLGYLYYARPHTLHHIIADMKLESLVAYHPGDATPVAKLINRFLGFSDD